MNVIHDEAAAPPPEIVEVYRDSTLVTDAVVALELVSGTKAESDEDLNCFETTGTMLLPE